MRFGQIDHLILFGGGARLLACLDLARTRGFRVEVVSAPRLLTALLDDGSMTVAVALRGRGVSTFEVEDLHAFDLRSHITSRTIGISFGAPWIFRQADIDAFDGRLLNAHGTCLPENRGGATFSWQILRGDRRGAFLFHQVDTGVDTGPIVMVESYTFPESCRTPSDYRTHYLAHEPAFLERFLDRLHMNDDFSLVSQDEAHATYYPRLATSHHAYIDWLWRAEDIARFIAAFDRPYDGAMTFHRGRCVTLHDAKASTHDGAFHPFMRGLIIRKHGGSLTIAVSDGTVSVRTVRAEDGSDVLTEVRPGHRFVTQRAVLDDALAYEAVYDARGLRADGLRTLTSAPQTWSPEHSPSISRP